MKTIIAGSRDIRDPYWVYCCINVAIEEGFSITEVVTGCAAGVDTLGEVWATDHGIPVKRFPAPWDRYPRIAGIMRNYEMGDYAEQLIAIWDGKSAGTHHMIRVMEALAKPVRVFKP